MNPNSKVFKNKKTRTQFQAYVSEYEFEKNIDHSWERSDQLYLPDGDGRPTYQELKNIWKKIKLSPLINSKKTIRILPLKATNNLIEEVKTFLSKKYIVEMVEYKTEEELVKIIEKNDFDLKISSNDFSSIDLSENLKTTFNASRPYIFLNKRSPVKKFLELAIQSEDTQVKSKHYREIGKILLEDGLIAPLAYQRIWFYSSSNLDISTWSSIYPEISLWKVKIVHFNNVFTNFSKSL